MEANSGFNKIVDTPVRNNTDPDMLDQIISYTVQPSIGLAIILTNIALLLFYRHKSQKREITLLFLTSLTSSDVAMGTFVLIRFLLALTEPQYFTQACRIIIAFGGMVCPLVSAWCILLLSYQVSRTNNYVN